MATEKARVSGSVWAQFVASLYTLPGYHMEESRDKLTLSDYVGEELMAQAVSDGQATDYWIYTPMPDVSASEPRLIWRCAFSPEMARMSKAQAWFGWDDDGEMYCSVFYGSDAGWVVASAKRDEEPIAYRGEAAYVRAAWLTRRFPAAAEALAAIGLNLGD